MKAIVTADVADQPMTGSAVRWRYGWLVPDRDGSWALVHDPAVQDARPLVVIDPENRKQVERLIRLQIGSRAGCPDSLVIKPAQIDAMQAALREFANPTPPRPDEPTGLGAVVEDADGVKYVRVAAGGHGATWRDAFHDNTGLLGWSLVDAVRVLSPGVTEGADR